MRIGRVWTGQHVLGLFTGSRPKMAMVTFAQFSDPASNIETKIPPVPKPPAVAKEAKATKKASKAKKTPKKRATKKRPAPRRAA